MAIFCTCVKWLSKSLCVKYTQKSNAQNINSEQLDLPQLTTLSLSNEAFTFKKSFSFVKSDNILYSMHNLPRTIGLP